MAKHTDATSEDLGKERDLPLGEIGNPGPIERASEADFVAEADLEMFMHELVTLVVHEDTNDNAVEFPCISVNGVNQPFIRGKEQTVKRKYLEQLAHTRVIKYVQKTPDASRPENIQMTAIPALVYNFTVTHDPNPLGKTWLKALLAQPN